MCPMCNGKWSKKKLKLSSCLCVKVLSKRNRSSNLKVPPQPIDTLQMWSAEWEKNNNSIKVVREPVTENALEKANAKKRHTYLRYTLRYTRCWPWAAWFSPTQKWMEIRKTASSLSLSLAHYLSLSLHPAAPSAATPTAVAVPRHVTPAHHLSSDHDTSCSNLFSSLLPIRPIHLLIFVMSPRFSHSAKTLAPWCMYCKHVYTHTRILCL